MDGIRSIKYIDEYTKKLMSFLIEPVFIGNSEDYFEEYDYEDLVAEI